MNASSYGSAGPEANRAAFHSTPNALSGGGILQAGDDNPPVDDSYADPCAGIAVASAIMIGLAVARRFGIGQYLETTMLCSAGFVHSNNLVAYDGAPARLSVDGGQHGLHALYRLYPCSEGWLFLAVLNDADWRRFAQTVGHPEWLEDGRFAVQDGRRSSDAQLAELIGAALASRSADEWESELTAADVAAVRSDVHRMEQFLEKHGLLQQESHSQLGDYWRLPSRVKFDGSDGRYGKATLLGESTVAVLHEFGFTDDEVGQFLDSGVALGGAGAVE